MVNILLGPRPAGLPYKSAYVAAKHGLEGLSKVIALEGGPEGVTSNCIYPAYVHPLVEGQIADQADPQHLRGRGGRAGHAHRAGHQAPAGARRGVADAVLFLRSDAAAFVNGTSWSSTAAGPPANPRAARERGSQASTVVPMPGALARRHQPPAMSACSRMLMKAEVASGAALDQAGQEPDAVVADPGQDAAVDLLEADRDPARAGVGADVGQRLLHDR